MVCWAWALRFERSQSKKTMNDDGWAGGGGGGGGGGAGSEQALRKNAAAPATSSFLSMNVSPRELRTALEDAATEGANGAFLTRFPANANFLTISGPWR